MSILATEFPVSREISKSKFVAEAIAWVRGINRSKVLEEFDANEVHDDDAFWEHADGEKLAIKVFEDGFTSAYGVRLEIADDIGRSWRTECVYKKTGSIASLRVRGQCVALTNEAQIQAPLKPHFITQCLEEGWASPDGIFTPQIKPHFLNKSDFNLALSLFKGEATRFLPSVYISRNNDDSLPLNPNELAKKLAGLAHVVVEPNRGFSFELQSRTMSRNPYGGAIGLFAPNGEQFVRLFRRFEDRKGTQLLERCISDVTDFVSPRDTVLGWDWQELQEAQARKLREKLNSTSPEEIDEFIETFQTENDSLREQIENLRTTLEIEKARAIAPEIRSTDIIPEGLANQIGPELYQGEFSDRLRFFIETSLKNLPDGLDKRTQVFAKEFLTKTSSTGRSVSLEQQIKSAARDGNKILKNVGAILSNFGYEKLQDGKHPKFTPPKELFGLPSETFPSTPSDSQRGGKNRGSEIIRNLGLTNLKR